MKGKELITEYGPESKSETRSLDDNTFLLKKPVGQPPEFTPPPTSREEILRREVLTTDKAQKTNPVIQPTESYTPSGVSDSTEYSIED